MEKYFYKQLDIIKNEYDLKECDAKEFASFKAGSMKIKTKQYEINGVGNLCFLEIKAMMGLMKMYTMIITPKQKDLPLFSFDYIKAMGKKTLLVEEYDVLINKDNNYTDLITLQDKIKQEYKDLKDKDLGSHWYDDIKLDVSIAKIAKKEDTLITIAKSYLNSYLDYSKLEANCDITLKTNKCLKYVDGMFENDSPTTSIFKKVLGEEKAKLMFYNIVFGVK